MFVFLAVEDDEDEDDDGDGEEKKRNIWAATPTAASGVVCRSRSSNNTPIGAAPEGPSSK